MDTNYIAETPEVSPLTDIQREELDRRIAAYRQYPEEGACWRCVKEVIGGKKH